MLDSLDPTHDHALRARPAATPVLIGLRGSGKSTVGRKLSSRLGLRFVDLDDLTPKFAGAGSIAQALNALGEDGFRRSEYRALAAAIDEPGIVLSLGGGTPTAPGAADLLRAARRSETATVIYLRASTQTLQTRLALSDNSHRPSLTGQGVLEEIATLREARDPLYRSLADHIIEVGSSDAETLSRFIAQKLL